MWPAGAGTPVSTSTRLEVEVTFSWESWDAKGGQVSEQKVWQLKIEPTPRPIPLTLPVGCWPLASGGLGQRGGEVGSGNLTLWTHLHLILKATSR